MRTIPGSWLVVAAAAVVLGNQIALLVAQTPATPASITDVPSDPRFEVASVKRNNSGGGGISLGTQPGGRFIARNVTLRQLITYAYRIQPFQLAGEPDWSGTQRFDVTATPEGAVPPTPAGVTTPIHLMTRRLLAERFMLVVHEEEREMPVYVLTFARDDKRLGPGLRPSTFDCEAHRKAGASDLNLPPSQNGRPVCGMRMSSGSLVGGAFQIGSLAPLLAPMVQRAIVDRTGLSGGYDIDLAFAPTTLTPAVSPSTTATPADSLPSIFTALSEQLGLKLDSQRAPVKVLVIDRVQGPTED